MHSFTIITVYNAPIYRTMNITRDFFEIIRSRVNVSDVVRARVTLTKRGMEYSGLCPFHNEKTPSFTVNDLKKFYHCFGCGAHGDIIRFVSETSGLGYKEAAIKIANQYGIEIPKVSKEEEKAHEEMDEIYHILSTAMDFFQSKVSAHICKYLDGRSINQSAIEKFHIGYAPNDDSLKKHLESKKIPLMMMHKAGLMGKREDGGFYDVFKDRVMFPIFNIYGKVIGFGGRAIGNAMPKYINSPETIVFKKNDTLYGENLAIGPAYKESKMIVVEGYIDAIVMQTNGFENCVAVLGTAVTNNHLNKIWKSCDEIILCLDGDAAGLKASTKAIAQALPQVSHDKQLSFVLIPPSYGDPDEVITKHGAKYMRDLLNRRISLSEMIWQIEASRNTHTTPEQQTILENALQNYVNLITDKGLQKNYLRYFRDMCWKYFHGKINNKLSTAHLSLNITESQLLEQNIVSFFIHVPHLLLDTHIQEAVSSIVILDKKLHTLLNFIIDQVAKDPLIDSQKLQLIIKKTSFNELCMLLLSIESHFLDKSSAYTKYDNTLVWEILIKKYHLLRHKEEYTDLIQNADNDVIDKIKLYHDEIIRLQRDIDQISESLTQSNRNE